MKYRPELLVRTQEERHLTSLGIKPEHCGLVLKSFSFRSTSFRGDKLSPVAQWQWCEAVALNEFFNPLFIIASDPTDAAGVGLASWIIKQRLRRDKRAIMFNMAAPFEYRKSFTTVCLHNILHEASSARCEEIRDILEVYDYAFRCVVVAGSKNPEAWALTKLRLRPTAVFYLKDFA